MKLLLFIILSSFSAHAFAVEDSVCKNKFMSRFITFQEGFDASYDMSRISVSEKIDEDNAREVLKGRMEIKYKEVCKKAKPSYQVLSEMKDYCMSEIDTIKVRSYARDTLARHCETAFNIGNAYDSGRNDEKIRKDLEDSNNCKNAKSVMDLNRDVKRIDQELKSKDVSGSSSAIPK